MKKMMLNDVATQISDLDKIPEQDGYNQIPVVINLSYHLVKKLSVSYREDPEIIKKIIEEHLERKELQHHATSLSFDEKKPRKDQLFKILKIAEEAETYPDAERLKRWHVEKIIKTALNKPDERTVKKYLNCIQNYVKEITGREVYYNADYNLLNLKTAVFELITQEERKNVNVEIDN
jgi:hypothetical protein